jgi:arsenical pump membrane protein
MFVIVEGLRISGVTEEIYYFLGTGAEIYKYGYSSFLVCNLINNIPMSVFYASIPHLTDGAVYASIIGSNIGAFLTPIGALAGIMFTNLLAKQNIKYTFLDFIKYGVMISLPTITIALFALSLVI